MKKHFLLLVMLVLPLLAFSQTEERQAYIYNIITFDGGLKSRGFKARLDDGKKVHKLKDENGKRLRFRTPAAALMYLSAEGWEVHANGVTALSTGRRNSDTKSYWIIRKPCTQDELRQAVEEGLKN